jgi:glycosyltransferase involved in cell wall biosynthesis
MELDERSATTASGFCPAVCFIKNGPVIREYNRLNGEWKGNSAELIYDIKEVSRTHQTLVISQVPSARDGAAPRLSCHKEENIHLYSINTFPRAALPVKAWFLSAYCLTLFWLLVRYRPRYVVDASMQFLFCLLLFCRALGIHYVPNFSRATQLNTRVFFLLRLFRVQTIIIPGTHMRKVLREAGISADVHPRIPRYPPEFFEDVPLPDFPQYSFTALFVGRLEKAKGIHELIDAAIQVLRKAPEIGFVILGQGSEYDNVRRKVEQQGCADRIRLLGFKRTAEIGSYLRRSDILVFPSYTEGFAKTSLEAIYTQTPLIVTPLDSVRPYLENGKTALFVEIGSAEAIEKAILRLYRDRRLRLGMKTALSNMKSTIMNGPGRSLKDIVLSVVSDSKTQGCHNNINSRRG